MKTIILTIILALSFACFGAKGQDYFSRQQPADERIRRKPPIYYNVFTYYSKVHSGPSISFVLYVQYDILQFNKSSQGFTASYEVTLNFRAKETKKTYLEKIWQETVNENKFIKTNSKTLYHTTVQDIDTSPLESDAYLLYLEVKDKMSGKEFKRQIEVSTVLGTEKYKSTKISLLEQDRYIPVEIQLNEEESAVELNKPFRSYFELKTTGKDSIKIESRLYFNDNGDKDPLHEAYYSYYSEGGMFVFDESFPTKFIKEGDYTWRYQLKIGKEKFKLEKSFTIVWFEKPYSLYDMDKAIEPMVYILSEEEWNAVRSKSSRKLKTWFNEFWQVRDENKDTPVNEVMFQFYLRVDEANLRFRADNKEGWKTDRGKSFILYGEPDEIERQKHQVDSPPYEIWIYLRLNQKLTFVDRSKNHNYKLVSIEEIKADSDE